jgi:hypothetical protein
MIPRAQKIVSDLVRKRAAEHAPDNGVVKPGGQPSNVLTAHRGGGDDLLDRLGVHCDRRLRHAIDELNRAERTSGQMLLTIVGERDREPDCAVASFVVRARSPDVHAVRGPDAGNFLHRRCFDLGAHRQPLEDNVDLQARRLRDQPEQA